MIHMLAYFPLKKARYWGFEDLHVLGPLLNILSMYVLACDNLVKYILSLLSFVPLLSQGLETSNHFPKDIQGKQQSCNLNKACLTSELGS